jgi:hypothetical protein
MAVTTTSTLSEFIVAALGKAVDDEIAQHLFWPGLPLSRFIKTRDLTDGQGISATFPKYNALTAYDLTEGVDFTVTQSLDPSSSTLTATESGVQGVITRLSQKALANPNSAQAYMQDVVRGHVRSLMTKYDVDIMSLFASLDVTVGTTTTNITNANILSAVQGAAAANIPTPWIGILHPQQWADLVSEASSPLADAGASGPVAEELYRNYFVGRFYGVDWYVSSNVPTANAGADRAGALISAEAIGAVWALTPDMQITDDKSLRGQEIITTCAYAVGEIDGTMGIGIVTDA